MDDKDIDSLWDLCDDWFYRFVFDQHWHFMARCPHGQFNAAGVSFDDTWRRLVAKIEEAHG